MLPVHGRIPKRLSDNTPEVKNCAGDNRKFDILVSGCLRRRGSGRGMGGAQNRLAPTGWSSDHSRSILTGLARTIVCGNVKFHERFRGDRNAG